MRFYIDEVEIYPEYVPRPTVVKNVGIEIDPAFMERYKVALTEWKAVQDELCVLANPETTEGR